MEENGVYVLKTISWILYVSVNVCVYQASIRKQNYRKTKTVSKKLESISTILLEER